MGASWSSTTPTNATPPSLGASKRQKRLHQDHHHLHQQQEEQEQLIPGLPDEISLQILARASRSWHPAMKQVSRLWNSALFSQEIFDLRRDLGASEQWLYVLLKDKQEELLWYALDPHGHWRPLPRMPELQPVPQQQQRLNFSSLVSGIFNTLMLRRRDSTPRIPFFGCSTAELNGFLYVLGGFSSASATPSVWRYHPRVNQWSRVSPMLTPRAYCKTGVVNGLLYAVGGVNRGRNGLSPLQSAEVYDPDADTWTPVASMAFSGAQLLPAGLMTDVLKPIATGMAALRGRLWVPQSLYSWPFFMDVGGEVYDPMEMTWSEMPRGMGEGWPARQAGMKVSVVVEGRLLSLDPVVTGGEGCRIKLYDFERDCWQVVVRKVPVAVDVAGDGESPYLLAAWNRRLHVVTKDADNNVAVLRARFDGGDGDTVELVAAKSFGRAELLACQVVES